MEETEKTKDSRLAREFVAALPIELSREQQVALLQEFVQEQFVSEGMCADVAIHDTDGHNPHAHILLTVRPLTEAGAWQYKTEKEYLASYSCTGSKPCACSRSPVYSVRAASSSAEYFCSCSSSRFRLCSIVAMSLGNLSAAS